MSDSPVSLKAKPKWLVATLISLGVVLVLAIPVSAYFVIPTVKETVNSILKIDTAKKGTLVVAPSNTSGASVFINGEYQGDTPYTTTLPIGSYTVRLYKTGYEERYFTVNIENGQSYNINDDLVSKSVDSYQGWLTYRNDTLGFGFRYPSNWVITEKTEGTSQIIDLSYARSDSKDVLIEYTLTYESKNPSAYKASNLKIEESYDDSIGAVRILTRKVDNTVIDTLSVVSTKSAGGSVLTNQEMSYRDMFVDSVSFVNKTVTTGTDTTGPVYYKESTLIAAPNSEKGNYLLLDNSSNQAAEIINTNTKTIKKVDFSIPVDASIVDPNGEFVVYSQNDVVSARDLANGKTVELFRTLSDSNAEFHFILDSISPDSKYLLYRVAIHDRSSCVEKTTDGPCFGSVLAQKYGWKTGLYIYDLSGKKGNVYLTDQPFTSDFYDRNGYLTDWTNNSKVFYIEDLDNSVIYKYALKTEAFVSLGSYQLGKDSHYLKLDMWDDGVSYANDNLGIIRVFSSDYKTDEMWQVADNGGVNGVEIQKVKKIDTQTIIATTGSISLYNIISVSGKPYVFFDNSVWMYSLLESRWQAFGYLAGDTEGSDNIIISYHSTLSNNVLFLENVIGGQEERFYLTYVSLFDPISMTTPTQFRLDGDYKLNFLN